MAVLEVRNIKKNFSKLQVLKGIDFSLEEGEVLAIIGSSGSGKTTLLRCLNFLEIPDEGSIRVNDNVVYDAHREKRYTDGEIRQNRLNFGLVFQQFNLFPQYNVHRNLTMAAELLEAKNLKGEARQEKLAEINKRADELLRKVGLSEKAEAYPVELSGGQQQRVAIARALMLSPNILCFDEPTSALDPELTGEVLRVIDELRQDNRTMVVVTHEMEFARKVATKVIFMADGVIEEEGTPEEVFAHPKSPKLQSFLLSSLEKF